MAIANDNYRYNDYDSNRTALPYTWGIDVGNTSDSFTDNTFYVPVENRGNMKPIAPDIIPWSPADTFRDELIREETKERELEKMLEIQKKNTEIRDVDIRY